MCTALTLYTKDAYFGRNLDLDCSYGEEVCVAPRRFPLLFRHVKGAREHYAIIGMAKVVEGTPLFYDGANEHGLGMAGLNFPGNAHYSEPCEGKDNIASFEFVPWILGSCRSVSEAREKLLRINIVDTPFSDELPPTPLHWMIADEREAIVVESMEDGLFVHDNPAGVLTNNPPFPEQLFNLNNYRNLKTDNGENTFSEKLNLSAYSLGLGAIGLPGDASSMSRFVRAAFGRENSVCEESEKASVGQFFHLLSSVEVTRGICRAESGKWQITVYSSCMNLTRGLYYYTTYDRRSITCVDMHKANLGEEEMSRFPLVN